jgi:hypothetical protein
MGLDYLGTTLEEQGELADARPLYERALAYLVPSIQYSVEPQPLARLLRTQGDLVGAWQLPPAPWPILASRAPLVRANIHFSAHPIAFVKVFLRDLRNEARKTFKINILRG